MYLAAYDISHPRASRAAFRRLRALTLGRQKSVFECRLKPAVLWQLIDDIDAIIDPQQDRFLVAMIDLRGQVLRMGKHAATSPSQLIFIG